ncbi:hypothetical protein XENTR_v10022782 [Xenopus tropicalis]|nr:hypothetical protein XENTR_v10022782 [Xenopus tropicalis]
MMLKLNASCSKASSSEAYIFRGLFSRGDILIDCWVPLPLQIRLSGDSLSFSTWTKDLVRFLSRWIYEQHLNDYSFLWKTYVF